MVNQGLGARVLPCLRRERAVPKAATSSAKDRPKARAHFESLALDHPLELPARVTLIDDVITRGAQLFGTAWRIWEVRPDVIVQAFAVVRTISEPAEFTDTRDPRGGRIMWRNEECFREP